MPTSYEDGVETGELTTLRQYALRCVRAFGACIDMRDLPLNAPIPERFEPDPYYAKDLEKAQLRHATLATQNATQLLKIYEEETTEAKKYYQDRLLETTLVRDRVENMRRLVEAWNPPTEIIPLKEFMLSQLDIGFLDSKPPRPKDLSFSDWLKHERTKAKEALLCAEERFAKERIRVAERNRYLSNLFEALPSY